jgi:hypothetical protein
LGLPTCSKFNADTGWKRRKIFFASISRVSECRAEYFYLKGKVKQVSSTAFVRVLIPVSGYFSVGLVRLRHAGWQQYSHGGKGVPSNEIEPISGDF